MVGLEAKVMIDDVLPSWEAHQHDAYLALTNNNHLRLPIFYTYNTGDIAQLSRYLKLKCHEDVLQNANISTPAALPGRRPEKDEHLTLLAWLQGMLDCPGAMSDGGWTWVFISNTELLERFEEACPNLIWLFVSVKGNFTWALTHKELQAEIQRMGRIWRMQKLQELVASSARVAAIREAVRQVNNHLEAIIASARQQQAIADEMHHFPDEDDDNNFSPSNGP
ncbi:hypothetical protein AQ910_05760 [Burkholderia pseudomallei]|nr:hypothetical protein AQ910_05760 [Burkholderia pseudomallei]